MTATPRPIGYWLKRLDRAIDAAFETDIAHTGLTRRQWQMLSSLHDGPLTCAELDQALTPFWEVGTPALYETLTTLDAEGLIERTGDEVAATDAGHERRTEALAYVQRSRERLMDGLEPSDYGIAIDLLSRMTANVESGLTPAARPGR